MESKVIKQICKHVTLCLLFETLLSTHRRNDLFFYLQSQRTWSRLAVQQKLKMDQLCGTRYCDL